MKTLFKREKDPYNALGIGKHRYTFNDIEEMLTEIMKIDVGIRSSLIYDSTGVYRFCQRELDYPFLDHLEKNILHIFRGCSFPWIIYDMEEFRIFKVYYEIKQDFGWYKTLSCVMPDSIRTGNYKKIKKNSE